MTALLAIGAVTVGTLGLGAWGVRFVRTTSDLLVASRSVTAWWNAAAISGEYLSAASFLGIAGLEMKLGASALWQSLGFTAGYLALLLFVAAPLRRFGSYTIPDFAEARLRSPRIRPLAAAIVLLIGGFYLLPQLKGAGLALNVVTGAPYWVGVVLVAAIVAVNVAIGGMRGITYVQAFQFWIKVFAISVPACLLIIHFGGLPGRAALFGREYPSAPHALTIRLSGPQPVQFPEAATFTIAGRRVSVPAGAHRTLPAHVAVRLPAGTVVPVAEGTVPQRGTEWSRPVGGTDESSPLLVYSLLVATFLGTMGLPHILVRFYTNPDGHAARRTTVHVLTLLGLFYAFPAVYGAMGRALTPELYTTGADRHGRPHAAQRGLARHRGHGARRAHRGGGVRGLPVHVLRPARVPGRARSATTSGRGCSASRRAAWRSGARAFAWPPWAAMVVPALLALLAQQIDISILVGWAFAIAASTFCPMFLLGVWWTRLSARGAAAGMLSGAVTATAAIFVGLALGDESASVTGALLAQPAIVTVPVAFLVMIAVSLRDSRRGASAEMLALHAPEGLGLRLAEDDLDAPVAPASVMIER